MAADEQGISSLSDEVAETTGLVDGPASERLLSEPKKSVDEDDAKLSSLDVLKIALWPGFWPERVKVVFMTFLSFIICNMDRINVSVAIIPMAKYYGWSQSTVGIVQSAFFWGYVTTQIPGGYLSYKYGGKLVLGMGVIAWSLMTLLTPSAASTSLPVLLAERSRSLSLIYSGMYMGSVVGLIACPKLISEFGWQSVFYSFGAIGLLWWVFWQFGIGTSPDNCPGISDREKRYIQTGRTAKSDSPYGEIPWKRLLTHPASWAINISHFCCTWGYFVLLIWLPTYFNSALGFDLKSSAFLAVLPWLAMFTFANLGGLLADTLIEKGFSTTAVRKGMQTIGFMGPSVMLTALCFTHSKTVAVSLMTTALGLGSFSQSGVYSNHQDIGPDYAGILLGISNTFAAVPGIIGVALTGFILDATGGSWDTVFGIAVGFYILGTIVFNALATGERVF